MNNNDIVKELQRRGYEAELHEIVKNGVSMKGIIIRSNDPKIGRASCRERV